LNADQSKKQEIRLKSNLEREKLLKAMKIREDRDRLEERETRRQMEVLQRK
jgi:hypothetical protein